MKKLIPVILCCAMLLAACGSSADSTSTAVSSESSSAAEITIGGANGPTDIVISESTDAGAALDEAIASAKVNNELENKYETRADEEMDKLGKLTIPYAPSY